jgi:hypothetical protein
MLTEYGLMRRNKPARLTPAACIHLELVKARKVCNQESNGRCQATATPHAGILDVPNPAY